MAASAPYFFFYPADYLADTAHLTRGQHASYLLLLMNYWQTGKALNNANDRLAVVAKASSEEWEIDKQVISEFFDVDGDLWTHGRMEHDLSMVRAKSIQASYAGRLGGLAGKKKPEADAKQTLSESQAMNESMNEQINKETLASLDLADARFLANLLADKIEANGSKRPNVSKAWVIDMDRLIRLDGRTPLQVEFAIEWCQNNEFWRGNVMSPAKLRSKYDQLRLKAAQSKPKGQTFLENFRQEQITERTALN